MREDTRNPIRTARERAGLTQLQLAAMADLTIGTISLAERGVVTTRTLEAISKALRVPVERLRTSQENDMPTESSFITLRKAGAHLDLVKAKITPLPLASDEAARDLAAISEEIAKLAGADDLRKILADPTAGVRKAVTVTNTRGDLAAAERAATDAVEATRTLGRDLARRLESNPNRSEPSRAADLAKFERLREGARAAVVKAISVSCKLARATSDATEVRVLGAKGRAWIGVLEALHAGDL